jgi:uncharacterized protein YcbK (DUF882 family)
MRTSSRIRSAAAAWRWARLPLALLTLSALVACGSDSPTTETSADGGDAGTPEVEGVLPGDDDFGDAGETEGGTVDPPGEADAGPLGQNGCPILTFPSGIHLQTVPDATLTKSYASISDSTYYPKPLCFIDTAALVDPVAKKTYDTSVQLSPHFQLSELVATELSYSKRVLVNPTLIAKLEAFRAALGGESVNISSGYRSPPHQRAVCRGICGKDSCPGLCAARSRHSWGDAADIGVVPTNRLGNAGCTAKFNFVYQEGNHLHLDLNPQHPICTKQIL